MRLTAAIALVLPLLLGACITPGAEIRPEESEFAFVDLGFLG